MIYTREHADLDALTAAACWAPAGDPGQPADADPAAVHAAIYAYATAHDWELPTAGDDPR